MNVGILQCCIARACNENVILWLFIPFSSTIKTVGWVFRDSSVSSLKTKSIRFPPTYASCRIVKIPRVAKEIGARQVLGQGKSTFVHWLVAASSSPLPMVKSGRHHLVVVSNGPFWPLLLNTHFSLFSADISSVRVPLNWCYSLSPNLPYKSQVTIDSVTITQVTMVCLRLITILSSLLLSFSGHMCTFTVVTIVTVTSTYHLVPGVSSQLLHIWLRLLSLHFFKRLSHPQYHQPPLSTFQQVDRISLAKTSMQLIGQPLSTLVLQANLLTKILQFSTEQGLLSSCRSCNICLSFPSTLPLWYLGGPLVVQTLFWNIHFIPTVLFQFLQISHQ